MKKCIQAFWFIALIPFVVGCSGYRLTRLPGDIRIGSEIESTSPVGLGQQVRITTFSGEVCEGVLTEISPAILELVRVDLSGEILVVEVKEIAKLEVYQSPSAATSLGIASLVAGGLVGGYYLVQPNSGGLIRETAK